MDNFGLSSSTRERVVYSNIFREQFPFYLSIGMTDESYWDGDNWLPKAYREAEEIRRNRQNSFLWLQGKYVYDAIYALAPSLQAMGGGKPEQYVSEPYPLTETDMQERREREQKKKLEEQKAQMLAWMQRVNTSEKG